jgi:hypothetical protein
MVDYQGRDTEVADMTADDTRVSDLRKRAADLEDRLFNAANDLRALGGPAGETPAEVTLTRPGSYKPGVVQVRLIGPPEVVTVAGAHLAELHGDAWRPSTRKPSRYDGADLVLHGTLIVPVPRG